MNFIYIVRVWIVCGSRLLIQRRAETKTINPGKWDASVAGHVCLNETNVDAALREIREELGLIIKPSDLQHIGNFKQDDIDNSVYIVRMQKLPTLYINYDEVFEVCEIDIDNFFSTEGLAASSKMVSFPEELTMLHNALKTNMPPRGKELLD